MIHLTVTGTVKNCPDGARRWVQSLAGQEAPLLGVDAFLWALDAPTWTTADAWSVDALPFRQIPGLRMHVSHVKDDAPVFANLLPCWRSLPDDEVIVWLDGDDWLAVPSALATVAKAHADGAWVTYGSFITDQGGGGFSAPSSRNARREPFRASHLKTFRAGLVKAMRDDDFRDVDGRYSSLCNDLRVMFALLEMAPPGTARFIPNILSVYNMRHSFTVNASSAERARERIEETRIRSWTPYTPMGKLGG